MSAGSQSDSIPEVSAEAEPPAKNTNPDGFASKEVPVRSLNPGRDRPEIPPWPSFPIGFSTWPVEWRQRWGELSEALEHLGVAFRDSEGLAFARIMAEMKKPNDTPRALADVAEKLADEYRSRLIPIQEKPA